MRRRRRRGSAAQADFTVRVLHFLIVALYIALPVTALARAALTRRRPDGSGPTAAAKIASVLVTCLAGVAISLVMCLIYGRALNGHVPARQVLLGSYFATGLLLLLRSFDIGLLWGLRRAAGLHRPGPDNWKRAGKAIAVMLSRTVILVVFGLPFVMAAIMTYRPKVEPRDNPLSQLGFPYERVEFESRDGVKLVGWWIPAIEPVQSPRRRQQQQRQPAPQWEHFGRETVVVCHGLAASKSNQLILARQLVPGGFNVLAFDFRAHGESGGQNTRYGALEKDDVLGAVKWLRSTRSTKCEKIFGVGASMGGVALLAAAADDSEEARAISGIATYAAYDDMPALMHDVSDAFFRPPLGFLLEHLGLPMAGAHAGVNLSAWSPRQIVPRVWPRPVLFIHGQMDEIIPFERGHELFDAASQPKYHAWFPQGSHNDIISNDAAAAIVLQFFKVAAPVPVI